MFFNNFESSFAFSIESFIPFNKTYSNIITLVLKKLYFFNEEINSLIFHFLFIGIILSLIRSFGAFRDNANLYLCFSFINKFI